MFELIKRDPWFTRPSRDLMNFITDEPFFNLREDRFDPGTLPVDVSEKDHEVIVRTSLPGFKKDEIDIQVQNGMLTIKAEHDEEKETKDESFFRKERRYGMVTRTVALPATVVDDGAKAELNNGVLTLRIPQAETARPKRIAVK